jgi:hypothetical protein
MPAGLLGHAMVSISQHKAMRENEHRLSIPVRHRPFPLWGSTGSKQTLNGLFYISLLELESSIIQQLFKSCQSSFLLLRRIER